MSLAPRNRWKQVRELRAELDAEQAVGMGLPWLPEDDWSEDELKGLRECIDDVRLGVRDLGELYDLCGMARP